MPASVGSGVYTVRQQYLPLAWRGGLGSDVAAPATMVFAAPTWLPPETQPPAVTWAALHRKNVIVPIGSSPAPPLLTATVSVAVEPAGTPAPLGELLLAVAGSLQELNPNGPAKSLTLAVNGWAERVCGQNVCTQPEKGSAWRSIAPSTKSFWTTVAVTPDLSRQTQPPHGTPAALTLSTPAAGAPSDW